jgi:hypothetical protein
MSRKSSRNLLTPLCTLMLACDGANLSGPRKEKGCCGKCAEAQEKRARKPAPPRGENTALPEATRTVDRLKAALRGFDDERWEE